MVISTLKEELINIYLDRIEYEKFNDKYYLVSLPMFLDTGKSVTVNIEKINESEYIFSNTLYIDLENHLDKENLLNDYILNKQKFNEIKDTLLSENKIKISENLEKYINIDNSQTLADELFIYAHSVKTYYNHIYNYILAFSKTGDKKLAFSKSINKFLENYNKKYRKNIEKFTHDEFISNVEYFKTEKNTILSSANSREHILEALMDFETIKNEYRNGILFLEMSKKNNLNNTYIDKIIPKLNKLNIRYYIITNRENFYSDEYSKIEELLKNE